MMSKGNPLANVMKKSLTKSLTMDYSTPEILGWNQAAKDLRDEYATLVGLHTEILKQVQEDWANLAEHCKQLEKKMLALEQEKIGASDEARQAYTRRVGILIEQAKDLKKLVQAEPDRRRLEAERDAEIDAKYKQRAPRIGVLLQYMADHQLEKILPFSQLRQAKSWIDNTPTANQINSIIKTVDSVDQAIKDRNAALEKETRAREALRKEEEEKQKRLKAEQEIKQQALQEASLKAAQEDIERKQKNAPVKGPLDDAIQAVVAEAKAHLELEGKIGVLEGKLSDKKYSASRDLLEELKKKIHYQLRDLWNEKYGAFQAQGPGFDGLADALREVKAQFDGLSVKDAETLKRDLGKVLASLRDLAGDRTDYEDSMQAWEPDLADKKAKNPKVRGYVFTPALQTAKTELKDVVGILGNERRGRTSPNGNANHIHVRGSAQDNAIFDWGGAEGAVRLLGFVNGHMDREAPPDVLAEASRVEARGNGTNFTLVEVDLVKRTLVEVEV
jgi:hypothetical protein